MDIRCGEISHTRYKLLACYSHAKRVSFIPVDSEGSEPRSGHVAGITFEINIFQISSGILMGTSSRYTLNSAHPQLYMREKTLRQIEPCVR